MWSKTASSMADMSWPDNDSDSASELMQSARKRILIAGAPSASVSSKPVNNPLRKLWHARNVILLTDETSALAACNHMFKISLGAVT